MRYISIFDFIAILLKELGPAISTRYAGLRSRTIEAADEFKEAAEKYIDDIKKYYADNHLGISADKILEMIVEKGIPVEVYKAYDANTSFKNNKDAVYYFVTRISATLLNYDVLLNTSRKAERMEQFKHAHAHLGERGFSQLNSDQSVADTGFMLLPDLGTFGDENKINHYHNRVK